MTELELHLATLRDEIAFPPTPDLESRVAAVAPRAPRPVARRRRVALGLAILLAACAAVLVVSPGARSALRDLLGIEGASVFRVESLPRPSARIGVAPGELVTLAEARRAVSYTLRLPVVGQEPHEVLLDLDVAGGAVSIVWCCDPELILTQFPGTTTVDFVRKFATSGTIVEEIEVDGERGYWLAGDAHAVGFVDAFGTFHDDETRLAGNVLLWRDRDVTLRLEGALEQAEALALAAAIR